MATKYGVNATKLAAKPLQLCEKGQMGGRVRSLYDTYELVADLSSADEIVLGGKIPAGARVVDVRLMFDDLDGSGGTLDVGWKVSDAGGEAVDADGFLADVDVTSAGSVSMFEDQSSRPGFQKTFSEEVQPYITVDGDTDATSGTIHLEIFYVVD